MNAYEKLMEKEREARILGSGLSILQWDFETYMPPRGIQLRSEQIALVTRMLHDMIVNPEVGKLIEEAQKQSGSLTEVQKRNLFLAKREYDQETRVPSELVAELAKQQAISVDTWKKAKAAKNWKMFEPELQKLVDLSVKKAEYMMEAKEIKNVYDCMIDDYERAMPADEIAKLFAELRSRLVPLTKKCADASKQVRTDSLTVKIPIDVHRTVAKDVSSIIGYDTTSKQAAGRLDETEHPFTIGYYDDVRVTLHYHEDNIMSVFYTALHEGGHALYEQNLNRDWMYQPIGQAASMGIHESMSRFVENMIGRSRQFLGFYYPRLNKMTAGAFKGVSFEDFLKAVNFVKPSKIRVEADEVTYSLHVIIRFEIERDLFAGKIKVSELPRVWNQKYQEYLGIKIDNDSEGVMQDTHWASGYYGYFPSYAMGNVYDGMYLDAIARAVPGWEEDLATGKLERILGWLKDNVHSKASLYDPRDLAQKVTGSKLTAKPFLDYVEKKYARLFGF